MKAMDELYKHLVNKPKEEWCAGEQLEALRFYFDEEVKIVCQYMEDSNDGECFAILSLGHHYYLWKDSFGSCLGCDALEHEDGYEYIKDTMRNVKVIE